ncbi:MAG: SpoIID/LytB domain-containing protein [Cyanobacteria bacterium P01_D01_bin.1]
MNFLLWRVVHNDWPSADPQVAFYPNFETMLKQPLILRLLKHESVNFKDAASSKTEGSKSAKRVSIRRMTIGFAVMSALTGFAFTRSWPDRIQTRLQPDPAKVPLRNAGDPSAAAAEKVTDLFLTHQIFYRKLEAISGAAIAPTETTAAATATPQAAPATQATDAKGTNTETKSEAKPEAKPETEKVTASAPPAPAAASPAFSGTTIDSVLEMRVALARDVDAIAFATSHGGTLADLEGNSLKTLAPDTASLAEINGSIVVDGETMPSAFWIYPDDGGYVAIGSSWYRGRVLVALRERGLIAVNYVLLGEYLYSVVGTEMSSSWAIESLKAQAVAARSYALTHNIRPASEAYFDLDNTERFQAYKGISREDSVTQAAVLATAGEFISHEGGIVESLYAASQEIVDDAHKGNGMSQLGAKDLAEQGYSYQEILGHYYPGTALGRIETDQN